MFSIIAKYELLLLYRNSWLAIITVVMIGLIGFASYNVHQKVKQRTVDIAEAKTELADSDKEMLATIKKIENGEEVDLPYWKLPTDPGVVGFRHPRLAYMDAAPLAILATGQSDMYSHFMKTRSYGNNFALDIAEISNPVQLLFGTFDLAFVFTFIIPLLIIAFTYNILSKERELGTLRVVGAQPINITRWLGQKLMLRYVIFAAISVLVFLGWLAIFSPQAFSSPGNLLLAIGQILVYEGFWFALAGFINIKINNSSKNAMALITAWLLIVLVLPVTANLIGSALYPSPSRLVMLNKIRETQKDVENRQDKILDSYLRDHPELAPKDGEKEYGFWHRYFASQDILRAGVAPLLSQYDESLARRQRIINVVKYLSPAIILQESFTKLAGSSTEDYEQYKQQAMAYTDAWREHLIPMLFNDIKYSEASYNARPVFEYTPVKYNSRIMINIGFTALIALVLTGLILSGHGRATTLD